MIIGYARVSTHEQNLHLQQDALQKAGCDLIKEEKYSGATVQRPILQQVLEMLRQGDTLIVWRLDRLARSLKNLIEIVHDLEQRQIEFKSLDEKIDTTSSTGKLIFHIFAALAEFERNLIKDRTIAGLTAARARGRVGGRPQALRADQYEMVISLYQAKTHTLRSICNKFGICKATLYKYVKQYG